jgi:RND family efflux transporter MFP subunit
VAQARAELEVSKANLADCQSTLDVAGRQFQRAKDLREQKVASEAELDEAQANYRAAEAKHQVAEAQIRQKDAALKTAEVRFSYTSIRAAWEDGTGPRRIAERFVDEGAMLKANDPIVSVVDLSSVTAVVYVIERDFPQIQVGQEATVMTDAYADRQFTGKVVRLAPVLKEESRQARVEIEIPNRDGLLAPGMFVRARIQFAEHPGATVVPVSALVRRNGNQGVFLADTEAMRGHFVAVRVGIVDGNLAEVLEPKLEGTVVTLGQHLLEDGAAIVLPGGPPGSSGAGRARP